MSEQAILTNYSVYVVAEILALLNIKLEHVIATGVALTDDMIAEKADQLVLMCKKAAQLEGHSKDTVDIAVTYMRSQIKEDQMEDVKRLTIENAVRIKARFMT